MRADYHDEIKNSVTQITKNKFATNQHLIEEFFRS